ncbi:hypothetical protein Unana1_07099 [Umbelopsis nana]
MACPPNSFSEIFSKPVGMSDKRKKESGKATPTSAQDYKAYLLHALHTNSVQRFSDFQIAVFLTVVAGMVRLYKIWEPSSVVFDEVHFGKFAGKYINHTYFFDVHPPLAKLLIAGVGSAAGYDGKFEFSKIGQDYLESGVPYVTMRLFCGVLGVLTIPMSYITVKAAGHSTAAGLVAAVLTCFGCSTLKGLWDLWGDLSVTPGAFSRHFVNRALYLILVPIAIYLIAFGVHFAALPLPGDGDVHMSAAFQQTLVGNEVPQTSADVAYGSIVSIRHLKTNGGYLHSHSSRYETGSQQQQITLYGFRDDNNLWRIRKGGEEYVENSDELEWVKNGDIIRLEHVNTSPIMLHSHDHRPPVTDAEYHNEVSGYGFPNYDGDANDYWRVEIVDHSPQDPASGDRLKALRSVFRLIHINEGCALFSHSVKLPKWGFDQQEVTCIKGGTKPKTQWYIEQNDHYLLPASAERVGYELPGFWKKFLELNQVMWTSNAGLVESHPYDSRPPSWPILQRGISMWSQGEKQIYLLGNPIIYWGTTWSIFSYLMVRGVLMLRHQRGYPDKFGIAGRYFQDSIGFFVAGWAFHFLPFLLMGRQLFLHHYMPALYFGILGFGAVYDLLTRNFRPAKKLLATTVVMAVILAVFVVYAPITYGTSWSREECLHSKVMEKWDYSCDTYINSPTFSSPEASLPLLNKRHDNDALERVDTIPDDAMNAEAVNNQMQPTPSASMDEHSGEFYEDEDDDDEWYRVHRPDYSQEGEDDDEEEEEEEDED